MEKLRFIEAKSPNMQRVTELLAMCRAENFWANRGPLYAHLAALYQEHANLPKNVAITPCANGGLGLEALARLHAVDAGRPLRWAVCAFSFANLGRGYFADVELVDCDERGMLDVDALEARADRFDGVIVTNVFGCADDFAPYRAYAEATGKPLLIDNAAGLHSSIPDWPWQSFSLHHTKPYGFGEGGLMLTPARRADHAYALIDYGALPKPVRAHWLNNAKISDVACAFLIDRLEQVDQWAPKYVEQAERVTSLAREAGFEPLFPDALERPAMSRAFKAPAPVPAQRVQGTTHISIGKYYKPLGDLPRTKALYEVLVNIPTHPGMALVDDAAVTADLAWLSGEAKDIPANQFKQSLA